MKPTSHLLRTKLTESFLAGLICTTSLLFSVIETFATQPKHLLVVSTTVGFRHSSIETAEQVLAELGRSSGAFTLDYARVNPRAPEFQNPDTKKLDDAKYKEAVKQVLAEKMSATALKKYDGVIFANTTGDIPIPDREAFLAFIKSGKAFIGMHSCSDTFHGWPEFIQMLGGEFRTHNAQATVQCLNEDRRHPATKHLSDIWTVHDEIYLIKNFDRSTVHGLLTLDKEPNKKTPGDYPISWCKAYGKGRVFYTSLGHREDVWDPNWGAESNAKQRRINSKEVALAYQQHVLGGIQWALKLKSGSAKPQGSTARKRPGLNADGFYPLFDGKDLAGWKLRNPGGPSSWTVKNGQLINTVNPGEHGTDLVTEDKFWNFTVRYEYKVPAHSNSGFYLRGRHEIQILDDYERGRPDLGGNGAIYQHTAPAQFASKPVGEWNSVEATMIGNKITVIMNGKKIHDNVECDRATGSEIDNKVKEPGPFFLQGDHGSVSFRNIWVKELP